MLQLAWDAQAPALPTAAGDTDHGACRLGHGAKDEIHDLGHLLHVISSSMDLLERRYLGASGPKAGSILSSASDALAKAAQIARRMPAPARQVRNQDMRTTVASALERAARQARALVPSKVRNEVSSMPYSMAVACAQLDLDRALLNLIINAVQALHGTGTLRIGAMLETAAHETQKIRIFIQDNGIGMDEAVKAKLFRTSLGSKPFGHGLGLACVVDFASAAGGSVSVVSQAGKGTCVSILLPAFPCFRE